jgi:hypothetical protein
MNPQQLIKAYSALSEISSSPAAQSEDKLRARINVVLSELESAHVILYQERAQQVIRAERAAVSKQELVDENKEKFILENSNNNYYKYLKEPEPKKWIHKRRRLQAGLLNLPKTLLSKTED